MAYLVKQPCEVGHCGIRVRRRSFTICSSTVFRYCVAFLAVSEAQFDLHAKVNKLDP